MYIYIYILKSISDRAMVVLSGKEFRRQIDLG